MKKVLFNLRLGFCLAISSYAIAQTKLSIPSNQTNAAGNQKVANSVNLDSEFNFLFVYFEKHPESKIIEKLETKGIIFLNALSEKKYLIRVKERFKLESLKQFGVKSIEKPSSSSKIAPELSNQKAIPNFAARSQNRVKISILFFKGVSAETAETILAPFKPDSLSFWTENGVLANGIFAFANIQKISAFAAVQHIDVASETPIPFEFNNNNIGRLNALKALPGLGLGLTGNGVTVGVGDGGFVEPHLDFQRRIVNTTATRIGTYADHQEHVTGILTGSGTINPEMEGAAPKARIITSTSSSIVTMASNLHKSEGLTLTNNSYGIPLNCFRAGQYTSTSAMVDQQLMANPKLLHVFAAGNSGWISCNNLPIPYFSISEGFAPAKNVLTVGGLNLDEGIGAYSSGGPVKDGRTKPEIVAAGDAITSTTQNNLYNQKGGTSMATPLVTGTLALLTEYYKNHNNQNLPDAALLKTLVCNSADDIGNPNVDFASGFGKLNAGKALANMASNSYKIAEIGQSGTYSTQINIPPGCSKVKVMLYWPDEEGLPNGNFALVNNLDLSLVQGQIKTLPWVLDPDPWKVKIAAVRGIDSVNNIEQATLENPAPGSLQINVFGKRVPLKPVRFYIAYDFIFPKPELTHPIGQESFKPGSIRKIRWDANGFGNNVKIELSTNGGQSWSVWVHNYAAWNGSVDWLVPQTFSGNCLFRISDQQSGEVLTQSKSSFSIMDQPMVVAKPCEKHIFLSWQNVPGAIRYLVFRWNDKTRTLDSVASISNASFRFSNVVNGKTEWFAVQAFGQNGAKGLRSVAVKTAAIPGACPTQFDAGISQLMYPISGRQFTSTALYNAPLKFRLQNYGTANLQKELVPIKASVNGIPLQIQQISGLLEGGKSDTIHSASAFPFAAVGSYQIKIWTELSGDENMDNDTLNLLIQNVPNNPVQLPIYIRCNASNELAFTQSEMGISTNRALDAVNLGEGRIRMQADSTGLASFTLDKAISGGSFSEISLIYTANLSTIETPEKLLLDFEYTSFGEVQDNMQNKIWVRSSDTESWTEVVNLFQNRPESGVWKKVSFIDLMPFLDGKPLSSSFQLRFTYQGNREAITKNYMGGYAFRNISLFNPGSDIQISKLQAPQTDCGIAGPAEVKILLKSNTAKTLKDVKVSYRLNGSAWKSETIDSLAGGAELSYAFQNQAFLYNPGLYHFDLAVAHSGDGYTQNDTLRKVQVLSVPVISNIPYYEDFESNNGYWQAYGTNVSWQWGKPASTLQVADTSANGFNCWKTNLKGAYNANEVSYLESPCFNFSEAEGLLDIAFNKINDTEFDYDFAWMEFTEDGINWTKLGNRHEGVNWYNHGGDQWDSTLAPWKLSSISFVPNQFTNKTRVRFRFVFSTDISITKEGMAIDDFHIHPHKEIYAESDSVSTTITSVGERQWLPVMANGKMIAAIQDAENMGKITFNTRIFHGNTRNKDQVFYLNRNYVITPEFQPKHRVNVRLFVTQDEINQLANSTSAVKSFQQLGIYHYHAENEDFVLENNSKDAEAHEFIQPRDVTKVPWGDGYYLEFSVERFSEFWITPENLANDGPLPLHLLSFEANRVDKKSLLDWTSTAETNLSHFEIEASGDAVHFQTVGRVGAMNKEGKQSYFFLHEKPQPGMGGNIYYRLKMVDNDLTFSYSPVRRVSLETPKMVEIYPNPCKDAFWLENLADGITDILIFDASGKLIHSRSLHQSFSPQSVSIGNQKSGIYTVVMQNESGVSTHRLHISP